MKSLVSRPLTILTVALSLAVSMLASCIKEVEIPEPQPSDTGVTFVVSAAVRPQSVTRAIDEGFADDNEVRDITVLLFDASMTTLTIDDIEAALSRPLAGRYNSVPGSAGYAPFVMSSNRETVTLPLASANYYSDNPISLARDVAKINVRFASQAVSAQLAIDEIRLCNYNTTSHAVATPALWSAWNGGDITSPLFDPSAPRPAGTIETGLTNGIVYDGDAISGNECVDWIFTPEQPAAASDNLCLLVRGDVTMGGKQYSDRWYKIDFIREDGGTLQHVNILRNYHYTVNISGVGSAGYGSPEEAYEHAAEGIVTEIYANPGDGVNVILYNGEYMLAVDRSELVFPGNDAAGHTLPLRVYTDYSGGWQVSGIDWNGSETGWFSVTTAPMHPTTGTAGTTSANFSGTSTPVILTLLTANSAATPRTATIALTESLN